MSEQVVAVAAEYQRREMLLAGLAANRVLAYWEKVDPRAIRQTWAQVAPALQNIVVRAQTEVALAADPYLVGIAAAQSAVTITEAAVKPHGFAGVAADGRTLGGALLTGPLTALSGIAAGVPVADAMDAGRNALKIMVDTQIADASRAAVDVSMFMREGLPDNVTRGPGRRLFVDDGDGRQKPYFRPKFYVRMVQPGACSRCIILAGVRYRSRQAFLRHERCHCVNIPVDENIEDVPPTDPKAYFESLSEAEQNKAFTKAGAEAIRAGADMNQVVNARRGMSFAGTSADGTHRGQKASPFTNEGVTKRGLFGVTQTSFQKTPDSRYTRAVTRRLMPEEIFRRAKTREEAVRLLRENAFIF